MRGRKDDLPSRFEDDGLGGLESISTSEESGLLRFRFLEDVFGSGRFAFSMYDNTEAL